METDSYYVPTTRQSYKCQKGVFFAMDQASGSTNKISFVVDDLEGLYSHVKEKVDVGSPMEKTPWGTRRFVIRDPGGNLLSFAQKE